MLWHYVNDRPYVASSFLSVALARVFGSALNGANRDRPDLAQTAIPLEAELPVLPCRGGEAFLRRLFEQLGCAVEAARLPLDPSFPEWGESVRRGEAHNVRFESLPAGRFRHRDHRFEWTREQFHAWAHGAGDRFGYTVTTSS